jgi:hypothetical protein
MRFLAAIAAIALLTAPAHAQGSPTGGRQPPQKAESKAPKADEQAYKDALKRIPAADPKKADPWSSMR